MWTITGNKNWQHLEETFDWVADMQAVPQDTRHHAEGNVAIHTQMVLQALEEQPLYQQLDAQQQAYYGLQLYCMMWKSAAPLLLNRMAVLPPMATHVRAL